MSRSISNSASVRATASIAIGEGRGPPPNHRSLILTDARRTLPPQRRHRWPGWCSWPHGRAARNLWFLAETEALPAPVRVGHAGLLTPPVREPALVATSASGSRRRSRVPHPSGWRGPRLNRFL